MATHNQEGAPASYPPLPPRPSEPDSTTLQPPPPYHSQQRTSIDYSDDISNPINYTRDPHKLIAYLVPFPKPNIKHHLPSGSTTPQSIPDRFLIYTPPPPPLSAPADGQAEGKLHKVQRKWQDEVRAAKTSDAKIASWQGVKGRATKGISAAMSWTTSSSLDFVNRIPGASGPSSSSDHIPLADDNQREGDTTDKTVGLEEMILIYPPHALAGASEAQIRQEFVNTMLRTKSLAQRDAVIATGTIPVAFAIDVLATLVWPFGGLAEIDSVWAYASIRGAKTARSVTKRLNSSSSAPGNPGDGPNLKLTFTPSPRLEVLRAYLTAQCHARDPKLFQSGGLAPTETEVLEAIGWSPHGETKNWEDEQWELQEVKDDLKATMQKGAREWDKWCKGFEKDPDKALKK